MLTYNFEEKILILLNLSLSKIDFKRKNYLINGFKLSLGLDFKLIKIIQIMLSTVRNLQNSNYKKSWYKFNILKILKYFYRKELGSNNNNSN